MHPVYGPTGQSKDNSGEVEVAKDRTDQVVGRGKDAVLVAEESRDSNSIDPERDQGDQDDPEVLERLARLEARQKLIVSDGHVPTPPEVVAPRLDAPREVSHHNKEIHSRPESAQQIPATQNDQNGPDQIHTRVKIGHDEIQGLFPEPAIGQSPRASGSQAHPMLPPPLLGSIALGRPEKEQGRGPNQQRRS